jgi:hypothetical protein
MDESATSQDLSHGNKQGLLWRDISPETGLRERSVGFERGGVVERQMIKLHVQTANGGLRRSIRIK